MRARIVDWLQRYKWLLFALWLVHAVLIHYYLLGLITWDGFGHRGVPVVELVQNGSMNKWKYYEWSLAGYYPFVELAHLPFLWLFGLRGFLFSFPLVVLPLCAAAVYLFVGELTVDRRAALFGALAYVAMPMINAQPFAAYVDFAVSGLFAYFLYALLKLRSPHRWGAYVRVVVATVAFTMARVQSFYMILVVFPLIAYVMFFTREGRCIRITNKRGLLIAIATIAIGCLPVLGVQIWKYVAFDSPTYPVRFQFLGIQIGSGGIPLDEYMRYGGIGGADVGSLAKGFFEGWVWHGTWPIGAFYSSLSMAAGLVFLLAVVLVPWFARTATRLELWLLAGFAAVTLIARDFGVPRWSYTITLALIMVVGRAMAQLVESRRAAPMFWFALVVLVAHLARPEVDVLQYKNKQALVSPRLNVSGSTHFIHSKLEVDMYPDVGAKLAIVELTSSHFVLQLFGEQMSNTVIGEIRGADIGPACRNLQPFLDREPSTLFVDDMDFTKDCHRECAIVLRRGCGAYRITPGS